MLDRRSFLAFAATAAFGASSRLSHKERVDRALKGAGVDRPPFTFWHHFGLKTANEHARATLDFQRTYRTDLVKVMSDFPYPKPAGEWYQTKFVSSPFPAQIDALNQIRDGLAGTKYFVETIFNPYKVAENLSSPTAVLEMKSAKPQLLLDALEVIAKSEASHAKLAVKCGAAGVFLAIANAQPEILSVEDYQKFSEPFDRIVLDAVKDAPLNTLHLHGDHVYVSHFVSGWPAAAINYSTHGTKIPIQDVRAKYSGLLMAGIDERNYRTLSASALREQWESAQRAAGKKFLLAPGCSVPNESTPEELDRLPELLKV